MDTSTTATDQTRICSPPPAPRSTTARFRTHMANWLWGFYGETVDRAAGRLPGLAEFRERRREMFGVPWYLDLCEVAMGADLPDAVHRLPAFRALAAAVSDITALRNAAQDPS